VSGDPIKVSPLCDTHRYLLVSQTGFGKADPWVVLEVAAQIALFQACTADDRIYARVAGNAHRIPELGCMACLKPDSFGAIVAEVQACPVKDDAIGAVKALGERWVAAGARS